MHLKYCLRNCKIKKNTLMIKMLPSELKINHLNLYLVMRVRCGIIAEMAEFDKCSRLWDWDLARSNPDCR